MAERAHSVRGAVPSKVTTPAPAAAGGADNVANIARERASATFDSAELTTWLNGSPRVTELKAAVSRQLEADPEFARTEWAVLTLPEKRKFTGVCRRSMRRGGRRSSTCGCPCPLAVRVIKKVYGHFMDSNDYGDDEAQRARVEVMALYRVCRRRWRVVAARERARQSLPALSSAMRHSLLLRRRLLAA